LINLIGNALKFQNSNTRPSVQVNVTCDEKDVICFDVIDNGIGIPLDRRNRLFENFVQLDDGVSRKFGGTGLGLAISKHIAECMGGRIWLKSSESGVGSTFSFEYRLKHVPSMKNVDIIPPDQTDETQIDISKCRVLIAEDNKINQKVMLRMLKTMGITNTVMVDDGQQAVREFSNCKFDIVILDLNMPVLNGIDAARQMRSRETDQGNYRTPIIACTADATEVQHIECIKAKMDVVVTKPVVRQTLKEVILKLLQDT
jgi:CheY-like chemotaxis protein